MEDKIKSENDWVCPANCIAVSVLAGILLVALLRLLGGMGLTGAVFLGLVGGGILAWILIKNMCGALAPMQSTVARAAAPSAPAPSAPAPSAPAPSAAPAPAAKAPAATAPAAATAAVAAGTTLAGEEELASKKGDWKYEGEAKAEDAAKPKAKAKAKPKKAAKKPAKKAEAPAAEAADVDYDGDGVVEGKDEGAKPATLDGPREGGADNLKEIKGVGPKLEKLLNSMGFYHFDQIAGWTADEEAWVNANLEGFKGRVSRDDWIAQAKILAAGGDTEFSKRVDKGGVY